MRRPPHRSASRSSVIPAPDPELPRLTFRQPMAATLQAPAGPRDPGKFCAVAEAGRGFPRSHGPSEARVRRRRRLHIRSTRRRGSRNVDYGRGHHLCHAAARRQHRRTSGGGGAVAMRVRKRPRPTFADAGGAVAMRARKRVRPHRRAAAAPVAMHAGRRRRRDAMRVRSPRPRQPACPGSAGGPPPSLEPDDGPASAARSSAGWRAEAAAPTSGIRPTNASSWSS